MKDTLAGHLADLDERRLHRHHEFALLKLVRAVRNPDTLDIEVEDAAVDFLTDWSTHLLRRKCARFGLVLQQVRHLDACAGWVADWDARQKTQGGLSGWYEMFTSYGQRVAA